MGEVMYVILDLETTGTDPNLDTILEVGIVVADDNFDPIATFKRVIHWDELMELESNIIIPNSVNDIVLEMHGANNLWEESYLSDETMRSVQNDAIAFLVANDALNQELTGNTISFDRAFLHRYMPLLEAQFHYRNIDISTLKVLGNKFGIPTAPKSPSAHRGVSDCLDSLLELEHYLMQMGWVR
jgi:oligoribonuclease